MTAEKHSTLRAVIVPSKDAYPQETPTRRLLGDLGHNVTRAKSTDHAMDLLNADHADLLVVDVSSGGENRQFLENLSDLPASKRPTQVAIFTDNNDPTLSELGQRIWPAEVHVYFKPLHMHGLLSILRTMNRQHRDKQPN